MNGFNKSLEVSKRGMEIMLPYAKQKGVEVVIAIDGYFSNSVYGDYMAKFPNMPHTLLEIKAEQSNPNGNVFVEVWSNKKHGRPGWFYICRAERLWYYFLDSDEMLVIDFEKFRNWGQTNLGDAPHTQRNFGQFREVQTVADQLNDTWGRLVPISKLRADGVILGTANPRAELESSALQEQAA